MFYSSLHLIGEYANQNYIGFTKILKKRDKLLKVKLKSKELAGLQERFTFCSGRQEKVGVIVQEVERIFALAFHNSNRALANKELRYAPRCVAPRCAAHVLRRAFIPQMDGLKVATFTFGLCLGVSLTLTALISYLLAIGPAIEQETSVLILYRMMGAAILMVWCWGFDLFVSSLKRDACKRVLIVCASRFGRIST